MEPQNAPEALNGRDSPYPRRPEPILSPAQRRANGILNAGLYSVPAVALLFVYLGLSRFLPINPTEPFVRGVSTALALALYTVGYLTGRRFSRPLPAHTRQIAAVGVFLAWLGWGCVFAPVGFLLSIAVILATLRAAGVGSEQ